MPVWPVEKVAWGTTTWVESIEESVGGNGANTAYALAKLGVPVRLTGLVGTDDRGDTLLRLLSGVGVDITSVRRSMSPTTMSVCVVHPSGDRFFLHKPGASKEVDPDSVQFTDVPPGFTHFHLANPFGLPKVRFAAGEIMHRAKRAGLTTSVDTGWDSRGRWLADAGPCIPHTDILFVNESEATFLTGLKEHDQAGAKLLELGAGTVILKLGGSGCEIFTRSGKQRVRAFRVAVKDTTGAGDCFCAGFLAGLHGGLSYTEAARMANAVAGLKVQGLGGVSGVRSYEETVAWMASAEYTE